MLTGEQRAAVLGSPIVHSLSPVLHRCAYAGLGLTGWSYGRHEVGEADLAAFVRGLDQHWAGLSLTMPLKHAALSLARTVSPVAAAVGAANTLVRRADGGWDADNTDVSGVRTALERVGVRTPERGTVLIGSGATARSVLAALGQLGVRDVTFVVRGEVRPATLAQAARQGLTVTTCPYAGAPGALAAAPLVVSTVPAGGADPLARALEQSPGEPARWSSRRAVLLDVVYDGFPTPLATAFGDRGAEVIGGLELLVHQAARQVVLMTGLEPDVEAMRAAGLAALARRRGD